MSCHHGSDLAGSGVPRGSLRAIRSWCWRRTRNCRQQGSFATALLQQLRTRRSDLEQEQAQLRIEHGPNFPRVVEIRSQLQDLDQQIKAEDAKLVERFHSALEDGCGSRTDGAQESGRSAQAPG